MKPEKLVAMANQIASFFRSYPEEEAAASVRQHLLAFWTPAMVATLEGQVVEDPAGIDGLVVQAMRRADTEASLVDRVVSPAAGGQAGSDAG